MSKVKFISYNGKYPCLCVGTLVLEIEGERVELKNVLSSGGTCFIDNDYNEIIEKDTWSVNVPDEYRQHKEEITDLVNENVPFGCCGGCL